MQKGGEGVGVKLGEERKPRVRTQREGIQKTLKEVGIGAGYKGRQE